MELGSLSPSSPAPSLPPAELLIERLGGREWEAAEGCLLLLGRNVNEVTNDVH